MATSFFFNSIPTLPSPPTPKPLPFSPSSLHLHKTPIRHLSPLFLLLRPLPTINLQRWRSPHCPFPLAAFQTDTTDFEYESNEPLEVGSPWEGAVVYRRNASVTHLEYCTTLERLGLAKVSSSVSRTRASEMGMRVVQRGKGTADPSLAGGTPVLVSVDVTRKRKKLLLHGIVKTVIALGCNRCGQPAAKSIFSNFTLLLTEEPIAEEPYVINLSTIYEKESKKASSENNIEYDDEDSIDLDDQLHFPPKEKEIDISKYIRDLVHIEITIDAVCDPSCKGLCLKCFTNLNKSSCKCEMNQEEKGEYGPLKSLKKQMMQQDQASKHV